MIRVDSAADLRSLDNLLGFAHQFPQRVAKASERAFALPQGKPALIGQLGVEPGDHAAEPWGGWSTNKDKNENARRMYMYLIRSGRIRTDGKHYIRTHGLSKGYDGQVLVRANEVFVSITNKANKAHLYTKGRRQIPGHVKTGWQKDAPVVTRWLAEWRPYLIAELRAEAVRTPAGS
jgi:hypothetical protein